MLFSIIVPVYKVEDYLGECVDSLLSQSFDDFEIILVDDGSPDNCPEICEEYSQRDARIKTIHQKNQGLSSARNAGINVAHGDYLIFLDSDDIIKADSLKKLSFCLREKPEVLITEIFDTLDPLHIQGEGTLFEISFDPNVKNEVVKFVFSQKLNAWPSVQYIVSKALVDKFSLSFDVGYYHEDVSWTAQLFACASSFQVFNEVWYVRRLAREGSITNTPSEKRVIDCLTLVVSQFCSNWYDSIPDESRDSIFQRLTSSLFGIIRYYNLLSREGKRVFDRKFAENRKHIFRYAKKRKHKLFCIATSCLGVRLPASLVSLMER